MNNILKSLYFIKNQIVREKILISCLNFRSFFLRLKSSLLRNILKHKNSSKSYYKNVNLSKEYKIKYKHYSPLLHIDTEYFLHISFYNFILQYHNYSQCIEIGSYKGELLNILAKNNPKIKFKGYDINKSIEEIDIFSKKNLKFYWQNKSIMDFDKLNNSSSLLITKGTLMYYTEKEIIQLFKNAKDANINIALCEPTRYQFNNTSRKLNSNIEYRYVSYSHPYSLLLKNLGYNIIYDSNMNNLRCDYTKNYKPYILTFVYASLNSSSIFTKNYEERLDWLIPNLNIFT